MWLVVTFRQRWSFLPSRAKSCSNTWRKQESGGGTEQSEVRSIADGGATSHNNNPEVSREGAYPTPRDRQRRIMNTVDEARPVAHPIMKTRRCIARKNRAARHGNFSLWLNLRSGIGESVGVRQSTRSVNTHRAAVSSRALHPASDLVGPFPPLPRLLLPLPPHRSLERGGSRCPRHELAVDGMSDSDPG